MDKIIFLKEQQIKKQADEKFEEFNQNQYVQNPLNAKLRAFKEIKNQIKPEDLI